MSEAVDLIAGTAGTPASAWRASLQLDRLPRISHRELLPSGRRLVVVAPHPDDEVLACGGLLASLAGDSEGLLISVTDGEGSHPDSPHWTPQRLRATRLEESRQALAELGLGRPAWQWQRLHLPDSGVHADTLAEMLADWIRPDDRLISTWRGDGHRDHEATGLACVRVASRCGARHIEAPIWAWHWAVPGDPRLPWARAHRLDLDDAALQRKRRAVHAHASQLEGPRPILDARLLETLLQPFEVYFL